MKKVFLLSLFLSMSSVLFAQKLSRVAPEQVGLDSKVLLQADKTIQQKINKNQIRGAVLVVVRRGKLAYLKAYGDQKVDAARAEAMISTGKPVSVDAPNDISVYLQIDPVLPDLEQKISDSVNKEVGKSIVSGESLWQDETHNAHWWSRYLQFMDEAPITSEDIVMLGNSLTENGGDWSGLGWDHVRNRGIIGDIIEGLENRLHQILPGKPRKIFIMSGTNDVSHNLSTDSIVKLTDHLITRIQKESPSTQIYLQSLLPINESFGRYKRLTGKTEQFPEINEGLRKLAEKKGIQFINLFPLFTEKGTHSLRKDLTTEGLHINAKGYEIWCAELRRVVKD